MNTLTTKQQARKGLIWYAWLDDIRNFKSDFGQ